MSSEQIWILTCISVALVDGLWFGILMRGRIPRSHYAVLWAGSNWLLTTIGLSLYPHVTPQAQGIIYTVGMTWAVVILVLAQIQTTGELVIKGYHLTLAKAAGAIVSLVVIALQILPYPVETYRAAFHLVIAGLYAFAVAVGLIPPILHLLKQDKVLKDDPARAVIRTTLLLVSFSSLNMHAWGWTLANSVLFSVFDLGAKVWGLHQYNAKSS